MIVPKARFESMVEWGRRMGIWGVVVGCWRVEGSDGVGAHLGVGYAG